MCAGEDCTLCDSFGKDVQVGDEEFDKQFRVKSKKPDFIKAVLNDAKLRTALKSQKNVRIEFDGTDDNGATLEITSYLHAIDIDDLVFRIALASQLLDAALRAHTGQMQDGSAASA